MAEEPKEVIVTKHESEAKSDFDNLIKAIKESGTGGGSGGGLRVPGLSDFKDKLTNAIDKVNPVKAFQRGVDKIKSNVKGMLPEFKNPFSGLKDLFSGKNAEARATKKLSKSINDLTPTLTSLTETIENLVDSFNAFSAAKINSDQPTIEDTENVVTRVVSDDNVTDVEATTPFFERLIDTNDAGLELVAEQVEKLRLTNESLLGSNSSIGEDIGEIAKNLKDMRFKPSQRGGTAGMTAAGGGGGAVPKAIQGLGALGKGFGKLLEGIITGIGKGFQFVGKNFLQVSKGALALGLIGAALIPASFAFTKFSEVDWKGVAVGITVLGSLVLAAGALGLLMSTGVGAAALLLGATAIGVLGAAMIPAAIAFEKFAAALNDHLAPAFERILPAISQFFTDLNTSFVAAFEGVTGAISTFFDDIAQTVSDFVGDMVEHLDNTIIALKGFNDIDASNLVAVGAGLLAVAGGMAAMTANNLLGTVGEGLAELLTFGKYKSPFEKLQELGESGPGLEQAGNGLERIVNAMVRFKEAAEGFSTKKVQETLKDTIKIVAEAIDGVDAVKAKALEDVMAVINPQISTGALLEENQMMNEAMKTSMLANPQPVVVSAPTSNVNSSDNSTTVIGNVSHVNRTKNALSYA